ncbi:MAG: hypothetical protein DRP02_01755 [Candidatus Gerdarchaeota archaeon]|nr:MAG: hypothetical protein DRO63_01360 [Candidatus Gerdarchaeota archaeon]RLI72461.1 MAG: hypothetical protein DRP02_01755 [Candidatus Gerdarchaeota archaeon]
MTSKRDLTSLPSLMVPGQPAILFNDKKKGRTLVVADLHIGYVYNQNKRGIIIPMARTAEEELLKLVKKLEPRRVIILGDFKDEIYGAGNPLTGRIFSFIKKMTAKARLTIIKGNHDGNLEDFLSKPIEIIPATGMTLELLEGIKIGLWHGHATPALDVMNAQITISAHAHPAYSFRDQLGTKITEKVWVKSKWREETKKRTHIIMPAFNPYIDGFSVDGEFFKKNVTMREGVEFLKAEVFTLEGVLLGTIEELQEERRKIEEKKETR